MTNPSEIDTVSLPTGRTLVLRLGIGFLQGFLLYLLLWQHQGHGWLAGKGYLFAPLILIVSFVPTLINQALGGMRKATLIAWSLVATALLICLGVYDIYREMGHPSSSLFGLIHRPKNLGAPSITLTFAASIMLFIGHAIVTAGDADRRLIARYPTYFDVAWRLGLQYVLAYFFVGAFWLVLLLGAGLFALIKLTFFLLIIRLPFVALPITMMALAIALHVTDVRSGLVRGVRSVIHNLLAFLLPILTGIALLFFVSLISTGLEPLWRTKFATVLLLTLSLVLIKLINAAYQDGEHTPLAFIRISGTIAAILLTPAIAIAGYALWLRIGQYGWTIDRVYAAACVALGGLFALGYLHAALRRGPWLKRIEPCNVVAAFTALAMIGALFSPIADPARISVEDQVARLKSGRVTPDKFDFRYLRWSGGRYGEAALKELAQSDNQAIQTKALEAQSEKRPTTRSRSTPSKPVDLSDRVTVYPEGRILPAGLIEQASKQSYNYGLGSCARPTAAKCEAFFIDLNKDGSDEIIIAHIAKATSSWTGTVLVAKPDNKWEPYGTISSKCVGVGEAFRTGDAKLVAPLSPEWNDIEAGAVRLRFRPRVNYPDTKDDACPD